eukprot:1923346-Prymnesium_polylepis.1
MPEQSVRVLACNHTFHCGCIDVNAPPSPNRHTTNARARLVPVATQPCATQPCASLASLIAATRALTRPISHSRARRRNGLHARRCALAASRPSAKWLAASTQAAALRPRTPRVIREKQT